MNDRGLKNNVIHSVYCPSHKHVGSRTLCWCFFHRLEASRREVWVGRKEITAGGWEKRRRATGRLINAALFTPNLFAQ